MRDPREGRGAAAAADERSVSKLNYVRFRMKKLFCAKNRFREVDGTQIVEHMASSCAKPSRFIWTLGA